MLFIPTTFSSLAILQHHWPQNNNCYNDNNINIKDKLIAKYGYPAEVHTVTTDDGYILTMHRIRGRQGAQPFFLQHGLVDSSAGYVIMGPNISLGELFSVGFSVFHYFLFIVCLSKKNERLNIGFIKMS